MIRRVQLSLNESNEIKLSKLDLLMDESLRVLNSFINTLWAQKRFTGRFTDLKDEDTWISARLQQALGKQALECVKSQRKKRRKTKPVVRKPTLNLDSRFLSFEQESNTFDFWARLSSLGAKIILNLPSRKHKHFNSFVEDGWTLKKAGRLRKAPNGWFLDVYFEKEEPSKRTEGKAVGLDCGYKKLLVSSEGEFIGQSLEQVYEKIARKKRDSKAYKRALTERDQLVNESINSLDLSDVSTVVIEGLKDVKKGSKGKFRKEFNNKLQYWSYRKCFVALQSLCEELGIRLIITNPAYTSQRCSLCGHVDKNSRSGEKFVCTRCGMSEDADFNASRNILMRGVYSLPSSQADL